MPRPKRDVRARGVARSLGAGSRALETCESCKRRVPRDAVAWISKQLDRAICGQCWSDGVRP